MPNVTQLFRAGLGLEPVSPLESASHLPHLFLRHSSSSPHSFILLLKEYLLSTLGARLWRNSGGFGVAAVGS